MITSVEGVLAATGADWVDVSVGGVTLRASVPASAIESLGAPGERVRLFTVLQFNTREESLTLFGFATEEWRSAFQALVGVPGVGPRVALGVLSGLSAESLALAIAAGDADAFKGVPGVGTKTANRIVLELKGVLDTNLATAATADGDGELVQALTSLGYTLSEAMTAISALPSDGSMTLEEKVRFCLQQMGTR